MVELLSWVMQNLIIGDWRIFVLSLFVAIGIIALGIIIGKTVSFGLKKIATSANIQNAIQPSFIELFIAIIKWSIYILFIEIAFEQFQIPQITSLLSIILVTIPAIVGALILIGIGFVIASYLKDVIEESKILNWEILSEIIFTFIIYIFLVFALKTALITLDKTTVNYIIIILTGIVALSIALWIIKKPKKR